MFVLSILCCLISTALAAERCCYEEISSIPDEVKCYTNDYPFNNMPLPDCNDKIQTSMRVYTRTNPDDGAVITRTTIPPQFRPGRPVHFVVHGWLGSRNAGYLHNMKDAGLDNDDVNMIVVGWSGGSRQIWYPQSASETRVVGTEIALVIENIVNRLGVSWDDFYCAGHSLGSHVCGHAGKRTQMLGGKIGRITGMDPAGPWFEGKTDDSVGLSKGDAQLVDVMHTNGESGIILNLGTLKPLGHMDFYPNGGGTQPGCILDPFEISQAEASDINPFVDLTPACSHMRALTYYTESMRAKFTGCKYLARSTCTDPYNIPGSCTDQGSPQGAMGFFATDYSNEGLFLLDVNRNDPHCIE